MNDSVHDSSAGTPVPAVPPREVHLLDVLAVLGRRRRTLLAVTLIGTAAVAAFSLVMPFTYTARVTILPPERDQRASLNSILAGSPAALLDLGSITENRSSDYYIDVLHSRTLIDSLFADDDAVRAHFAARGGTRTDQIEACAAAMSTDVGRDGLVMMEMRLRTGFLPSEKEQRAVAALVAEFAGAVPRELDRITRLKTVSRAHNARVYIEEQVGRVKGELDSLYAALTTFQRAHKVLALDKQVESEVHTAADLESQILESEYQLQLRLRSESPSSLETQRLRDRLSILRGQYAGLQSGADSSAYFLPFPAIPDLQRDYANLVRDVKALEQVYAYLRTQYFQERVQEERDTPTVQVLDAPGVPDQRTSPRRTVMVLLGLLVSAMVGCVVVFVQEALRRVSGGPATEERMRRAIGAWRGPQAAAPVADGRPRGGE